MPAVVTIAAAVVCVTIEQRIVAKMQRCHNACQAETGQALRELR
jgi:hypothetical protein